MIKDLLEPPAGQRRRPEWNHTGEIPATCILQPKKLNGLAIERQLSSPADPIDPVDDWTYPHQKEIRTVSCESNPRWRPVASWQLLRSRSAEPLARLADSRFR